MIATLNCVESLKYNMFKYNIHTTKDNYYRTILLSKFIKYLMSKYDTESIFNMIHPMTETELHTVGLIKTFETSGTFNYDDVSFFTVLYAGRTVPAGERQRFLTQATRIRDNTRTYDLNHVYIENHISVERERFYYE